jgi:iron(III) transport system ATP-binding protein
MLSVERATKAYADGRSRIAAMRDVTFEVAPGELFTLLGPSGCGKTTTLRVVAGLERLDAGTVRLVDDVVSDPSRDLHLPPERRGLGMVFQAPTVWPHMSVAENVAFPLVAGPRAERPSRAEVARRVSEALELVRLGGVEARSANDLSGGQQQRLALARALVRRPRLLLLDEPLSGLDEALRLEVREELRAIQRDLGVTMLYVTHDQGEALALSSRLAVMRDGALEQVGTPRQVYGRPANAFVAGFVGAANMLSGVVEGVDGANGTRLVRTGFGRLPVHGGDGFERGAAVLVVVRPEHVSIGAGATWRVVSETFLGDMVELVVRANGCDVRVRVDERRAFAPGATVALEFDSERLALVRDDGGR